MDYLHQSIVGYYFLCKKFKNEKQKHLFKQPFICSIWIWLNFSFSWICHFVCDSWSEKRCWRNFCSSYFASSLCFAQYSFHGNAARRRIELKFSKIVHSVCRMPKRIETKRNKMKQTNKAMLDAHHIGLSLSLHSAWCFT